MRVAVTLARPVMLSPRRGARTIVYLTTSANQQREPAPAVRDDATARKLSAT